MPARVPSLVPFRWPHKPWRRHLRATREGKWFILVTLGVGLAAFNTGNNLLYLVLGFMLSLIVLSSILSELVLRGLQIERRLPVRWFAGTTRPVELVVLNRNRRMPSLSLQVEDLAHGSTAQRRCYFLKIAPGSEHVTGYSRTPASRGWLRFTGVRLSTRYPFGIFEKWRFLELPGQALIYPRPLPGPELSRHTVRLGTDLATGQTGYGTDIAGIREYRSGDEARSIHWRRSAALGELVVREREQERAPQVVLVVDNLQPHPTPDAWHGRFERTISRTAALCQDALARGVAVQVVARGVRSATVLPGASPDPVLRFLALLQPEPEPGAAALPGSGGVRAIVVHELEAQA